MHLGGCLYGSKVLPWGEHTFRTNDDDCMKVICDTDGQVDFET